MIDEIINTIKAEMKRQKVDESELALRTGISYTGIKYWMSGKHYPTIESLELVFDALGIKFEIKTLKEWAR